MLSDPYPNSEALLADLRKARSGDSVSPFVSECISRLNQHFAPLDITLSLVNDRVIATQQNISVNVGLPRMVTGLTNAEAQSLVTRLLQARKARIESIQTA